MFDADGRTCTTMGEEDIAAERSPLMCCVMDTVTATGGGGGGEELDDGVAEE